MQALIDRILRDGKVKPGNILKVDSFLNHQCDIALYNEIGKEFRRLFPQEITKILTIEASGIGIACITAQYFNVPVVFAKKSKSLNLDGALYTSVVHSYTYDKDFQITVSNKFIDRNDKVLIIDDFLANGAALMGLIDILKQAEAEFVGAGIVIEKGFQEGGALLRSKGYNIQSLAIIDSMTDDSIVFRQ